jgi:hypothetical protein
MTTALFLSALLHPEAWWARYAPQLYAIPVLLTLHLWLADGRVWKLLAGALVALLIANSVMVALAYHDDNLENTNKIRETLAELKRTDNVEIVFHEFRSNRARLDQNGVRYAELFTDAGYQCRQAILLPTSRTVACLGRFNVLAQGSLHCRQPALVKNWDHLPESERDELLQGGACRLASRDLPYRLVGKPGQIRSIQLLDDLRFGLAWTATRNLIDPTLP